MTPIQASSVELLEDPREESLDIQKATEELDLEIRRIHEAEFGLRDVVESQKPDEASLMGFLRFLMTYGSDVDCSSRSKKQ